MLKETLTRKEIEINDIKIEMESVRKELENKIEKTLKEKEEEQERYEEKVKLEKESIVNHVSTKK